MVTIREVADAAGVSVSTASKGLHGKGRMREETRERIVTHARRLGFQPNLNATSLTSGRTYNVGLLTRDGYGRFTPQLLGGIEDALTAETCSLLLCDTRRDTVRERHYLDTLIAKRVDGLIITGRATDPTPHVPRMPFPVVYAYRTSDDPNDTSITVDDAHGGWIAGRQLLREGRTSLLHLAGPSHYLAVRERVDGLQRALVEAGHQPLSTGRIKYLDFDENAAFQAVEPFLAELPGLDGIFCGNDQLARGVVDALTRLGVRVPDDIAVVGFDNWSLLAAHTRPPLTSVDMNLYRLGRTVGAAMLRAIEGEPESGLLRLPCQLAIRDSCPAPADGDPVWHSDAPMIRDA